jgi:hypothetical protein
MNVSEPHDYTIDPFVTELLEAVDSGSIEVLCDFLCSDEEA